MGMVYGLAVSFGILFVHHFLSCRNHAAWGAILPVAYSGLLAWLFFIENKEFDAFFLVGLLILLGIWSDGRIKIQKKRKKELEKISVQDL